MNAEKASSRRWASPRSELDEPITSLGFVTSCEVSPAGTWRSCCGCRRRNALQTSRTDGSRRAQRRATAAGLRSDRSQAGGPLHGEEINAQSRAARVSLGRSGRPTTISWTPCASCSQRKALVAARRDSARRCWRMADARAGHCTPRRRSPDDTDARRCLDLRGQLGIGATRVAGVRCDEREPVEPMS